jgi:hypothetical protein
MKSKRFFSLKKENLVSYEKTTGTGNLDTSLSAKNKVNGHLHNTPMEFKIMFLIFTYFIL